MNDKFLTYFDLIPFQYKIDCRVTIELLDTDAEDTEKSVQNSKTWSNYSDRLANPTATTTASNATSTNQANNSNNGASNSSANNADSVEIKTEKMDEDAVSEMN